MHVHHFVIIQEDVVMVDLKKSNQKNLKLFYVIELAIHSNPQKKKKDKKFFKRKTKTN